MNFFHTIARYILHIYKKKIYGKLRFVYIITSCLHYYGFVISRNNRHNIRNTWVSCLAQSKHVFATFCGEFFSKYQRSINNLTISYCRGSPDNTAKLVYFMWRPRKCLRNILSQSRFLKQSSASITFCTLRIFKYILLVYYLHPLSFLYVSLDWDPYMYHLTIKE